MVEKNSLLLLTLWETTRMNATNYYVLDVWIHHASLHTAILSCDVPLPQLKTHYKQNEGFIISFDNVTNPGTTFAVVLMGYALVGDECAAGALAAAGVY